MSRTGKRTDGNHQAVRESYRRRGWLVVDTSQVGEGFPDLLCLKPGALLFLEVKDGTKPPSARELTEKEVKMHAKFAAAGWPIAIVYGPAD